MQLHAPPPQPPSPPPSHLCTCLPVRLGLMIQHFVGHRARGETVEDLQEGGRFSAAVADAVYQVTLHPPTLSSRGMRLVG